MANTIQTTVTVSITGEEEADAQVSASAEVCASVSLLPGADIPIRLFLPSGYSIYNTNYSMSGKGGSALTDTGSTQTIDKTDQLKFTVDTRFGKYVDGVFKAFPIAEQTFSSTGTNTANLSQYPSSELVTNTGKWIGQNLAGASGSVSFSGQAVTFVSNEEANLTESEKVDACSPTNEEIVVKTKVGVYEVSYQTTARVWNLHAPSESYLKDNFGDGPYPIDIIFQAKKD